VTRVRTARQAAVWLDRVGPALLFAKADVLLPSLWDEARRALAGLVPDAAGELTAADPGGALGWRRKLAGEVLDEVAEGRGGGGLRIWARE
jgi:hypothetical protein